MTRLVERLTWSWGLTLLLATGASAQSVPQGTLKPDEIHDAEIRTAEGNPIRPWSVTLGTNEVFESNVRATSEGKADVGNQLSAIIARTWTLRRGDVKAIGNVSQFLYRQDKNLNQFLYGAGASASYTISPRVFWNVSDMVTSSYAQDATALLDSGLLPPKLVTHVNTAASALRYEASPRTQIRWGLTEQQVSFGSSQFRSASALTTTARFARQLSRSRALGVTGEFQRVDTAGTNGITEGLLGTVQQTIGRAVTVTAAWGMRLYTLPGRRGYHSAPGGAFGLTVRVRRDGTLDLNYDRFVEQAIGGETHLSDQVFAAYNLQVSRRLMLNGTGNVGRGRFPSNPGHRRSGQTAAIGARYSLLGDLAFGVTYRLYRRMDTPIPWVTGHTALISLTYGGTWR